MAAAYADLLPASVSVPNAAASPPHTAAQRRRPAASALFASTQPAYNRLTLQLVSYQSSSALVALCEGLPPAPFAAASAGEFLTGL